MIAKFRGYFLTVFCIVLACSSSVDVERIQNDGHLDEHWIGWLINVSRNHVRFANRSGMVAEVVYDVENETIEKVKWFADSTQIKKLSPVGLGPLMSMLFRFTSTYHVEQINGIRKANAIILRISQPYQEVECELEGGSWKCLALSK